MEFVPKFGFDSQLSPYASVPQISSCSAPRLGTDLDYWHRELPDFYSPQCHSPNYNHRDAKRCKRKLDFCGPKIEKILPPNVARRNERERNRVRLINTTFSTLRQHLPGYSKAKSSKNNKKLSKVDTLKSAIEYISQLQELLDENDAVNAAFKSVRSGVPRMEDQAKSPGSVESLGEESAHEEEPREAADMVDGDLLHFTTWF